MLEIKNFAAVDAGEIPEKTYVELSLWAQEHGLRLLTCGALEENQRISAFFVGGDSNGKLFACNVKFNLTESYASIGAKIGSWVNFERELHENFGIKFNGHPWLKPVRYPHGTAEKMADYPFMIESGDGIHEVAVGPVHAGVIEPGHFRFMCRGEKIDHLEIQLGYQHRGIEKLLSQGDLRQKRILIESISGDTSLTNALLYAKTLEALFNLEVPSRAEAIRIIGLELEKVALHLSTLSGIANDIAYLTGAAFAGATRTYVINSTQSICGNRCGRNFIAVGGVNFDIDSALQAELIQTLTMVLSRIEVLKNTMLESPGVLTRLDKTGAVSFDYAQKIGLLGIAGRASGLKCDARSYSDNTYYQSPLMHELSHFPKNGDVLARTAQRIFESEQSLKLVLMILNDLPSGKICAEFENSVLPSGKLVCAVTEGPRGENVHLLLSGGNNTAAFYKLKDSSFINWLALALSVRNNQISDFPLCNKSFDLSYAGHDL